MSKCEFFEDGYCPLCFSAWRTAPSTFYLVQKYYSTNYDEWCLVLSARETSSETVNSFCRSHKWSVAVLWWKLLVIGLVQLAHRATWSEVCTEEKPRSTGEDAWNLYQLQLRGNSCFLAGLHSQLSELLSPKHFLLPSQSPLFTVPAQWNLNSRSVLNLFYFQASELCGRKPCDWTWCHCHKFKDSSA